MYTIRVCYPDTKYTTDAGVSACDAHTHSMVIDLLIRHSIHASQSSHDRIVLHDARDLTVALLALDSPSLPVRIDAK